MRRGQAHAVASAFAGYTGYYQPNAGNLGAMRMVGTWNGTVGLRGNARLTSWGGNGVYNGAITGAYSIAFSNDSATRIITID